MRDQISGISRLTSWSTRKFGPTKPAAVAKAWEPVKICETNALFRSMMGVRALNGPLVSAPSEPVPVVEGDLPVRLLISSMNSSGVS